jgi:hypothetical protein
MSWRGVAPCSHAAGGVSFPTTGGASNVPRHLGRRCRGEGLLASAVSGIMGESPARKQTIAESEQTKRLARDQLAGSRPPKLLGTANYDHWREAILAELDL